MATTFCEAYSCFCVILKRYKIKNIRSRSYLEKLKLPALCKSSSTSVKINLWFFPLIFNKNFKENQMWKLPSPSSLGSQAVSGSEKGSSWPARGMHWLPRRSKMGFSHAHDGVFPGFVKRFQVLLHQMEKSWFFGLVLEEIVSFPVPLSRDAKLEDLHRRETLLRASAWVPPCTRRGSSSPSLPLLFSGLKG